MARFLSRFAVLALAVTAGCNTSVPSNPGPLDRFYFPTGMAVRKLPSGQSALLVVSSNFDLQYDRATGGTVLAVDPDLSGNALLGDTALKRLGSAQMGSFGGEVAYADATNCLEISQSGAKPRIITASRSENAAYWMTMNDAGGLGCGVLGSACAFPLVNPNTQLLNSQLSDAFGVTIACSSASASISEPSAFITHLRATNDEGWVSRISLNSQDTSDPGVPPPSLTADDFKDLGPGDSYSGAFDETRGRLYITSRFGSIGVTPLRWLDLAVPLPQVQVNTFNFYSAIRGSLTRGLALSNDRTRGYMAVQIYDSTLASSTGSIAAVASVLAVLDLQPDPSGSPTFQVLQIVPIPAGPSVVKVLPPRAGKRDLVAVTCTDDGVLVLYEDAVEPPRVLAASIGLDRKTGNPILGKQPFGLAVESQTRSTGCQLGSTCDLLYVGSFDRSWINIVEVNPDNPSLGWNSPFPTTNGNACTTQNSCPALVKRLGRER